MGLFVKKKDPLGAMPPPPKPTGLSQVEVADVGILESIRDELREIKLELQYLRSDLNRIGGR